ncbi:hypothetical protein MMC19_001465 [Ptychographa xylographoides]|nr:hypothetical protein [Ptychographa xylographoides]
MLGRIILTIIGIGTSVGPYIADFNKTHIHNPRWPPHAKFHNGQTMSMGALLGLLMLYYTWRQPPTVPGSPTPSSASTAAGYAAVAQRENLWVAALFGSLYYVCGLSALLYPGALGMDPEFGEGSPQTWLFGGLLVFTWLGWWLEVRGIEVGKGKLP